MKQRFVHLGQVSVVGFIAAELYLYFDKSFAYCIGILITGHMLITALIVEVSVLHKYSSYHTYIETEKITIEHTNLVFFFAWPSSLPVV